MKLFRFTFLLLFPLITFWSCSGDDGPKEDEKEVEEISIEGDYRGTWNSSTDMDIVYTDFGISAKFKFTDTAKSRLRGEFFATSSFTSCCESGDNDGIMVIDLNGDTISSFSFNDIITDCTGNFIGTGSITSKTPYTLQIDFTGNDCDGNHVGVMIFKRTTN